MRTRESRESLEHGRSVEFQTLDRATCEALMARHHVGRLAFSVHDRVTIEPIHYVWSDGWLYGRTSAGSKLATLAHRPWVAFEVDEVRGTFDWESVVAHGTFHVVDPDGSPIDREVWPQAVAQLRTILPATFTAQDPVAFRDVVFRIHVDDLTGRAARG